LSVRAISGDTVKHLVLGAIGQRPSKLDLENDQDAVHVVRTGPQ
jgi:hypothetical protein